MAALSDAGAHCSLPSCRRLDFLPFKCKHCSLLYCLEHFRSSAHACSKEPNGMRELYKQTSTGIASEAPARERCPTLGCGKVLTASGSLKCNRCGSRVCLAHRYEDSHPCEPQPEPQHPFLRRRNSAGLLTGESGSASVKPDAKPGFNKGGRHASGRCRVRGMQASAHKSSRVSEKLGIPGRSRALHARNAEHGKDQRKSLSDVERAVPRSSGVLGSEPKAATSRMQPTNPKRPTSSVAPQLVRRQRQLVRTSSDTPTCVPNLCEPAHESSSRQLCIPRPSNSAPNVESLISRPWRCTSCTFDNLPTRATCGACDMRRPLRSKQVQWKRTLQTAGEGVIDLSD